MKDGSYMRCFAMAMIGVVYAVYMVTNAWCTGSVPDGVVFGTVCGAMCGLGGYDLAMRKAGK